jgi:hypothetical protein
MLSRQTHRSVPSFVSKEQKPGPHCHRARVTVIENAGHGVVVASVCLYRTALALRLLEASSCQCSHRVPPTVLLFRERTISPLSGLSGCPSGCCLNIPPNPPGPGLRSLPLVGAGGPGPAAGASRCLVVSRIFRTFFE